MSIQNSRFVGKFRPPEDSNHHSRVKRVFVGTDSTTGQSIRYYEKRGQNMKIDPQEWPKWKKSKDRG